MTLFNNQRSASLQDKARRSPCVLRTEVIERAAASANGMVRSKQHPPFRVAMSQLRTFRAIRADLNQTCSPFGQFGQPAKIALFCGGMPEVPRLKQGGKR
jgi:hypothetical protein